MNDRLMYIKQNTALRKLLTLIIQLCVPKTVKSQLLIAISPKLIEIDSDKLLSWTLSTN